MKHPRLNPHRFSEAAAQGLRVFPVNVVDGPAPVSWTEFETREPTVEELGTWDATEFNVGVMCGRPADIVVLVVKDEPIMDDFLRRLKMPATPYVRIGDERHFYFKKPAIEVGFAIAIGPLHLTAFSDGSTVVGAGSVTPSGTVYELSLIHI